MIVRSVSGESFQIYDADCRPVIGGYRLDWTELHWIECSVLFQLKSKKSDEFHFKQSEFRVLIIIFLALKHTQTHAQNRIETDKGHKQLIACNFGETNGEKTLLPELFIYTSILWYTILKQSHCQASTLPTLKNILYSKYYTIHSIYYQTV